MNTPDEIFTPSAAGTCDAFQWEISQALDESRLFSSAVREHLQTCPHCAAFAESWSVEGVGSSPLSRAPELDSALSSRLVQAALMADVPARVERAPRRSGGWLFRVAAVLALGALGWWLMDPRTIAPPPSKVASTTGGKTIPVVAMSRQMARLEQPLGREQAALHGAAVTGFARLREVLDKSSSALQ
jgi:hypothetical protein